MLVLYAAVLGFGLNEFAKAPQGFIPQQDRGFLIMAAQLPPGASLERTDAVMKRAYDIASKQPGVAHAIRIVGFSGATFTNAPNAGAMFLVLDDFAKRAKDPRQSAAAIQGALFGKMAAIQDAFTVVIQPPSVQGIGNGAGFRMMIEDRAGAGPQALQGAVYAMMGAASKTAGLQQVFSLFETQTPQLYLDIDRTKAQLLGIKMPDVFNALQVYLGSVYVNDFNLFGRTFRVQAQADAPLPAGAEGRVEFARAQFVRRDGAARLVHDRAQHFWSLPAAALQSLSGGRTRRSAGARLQPGPSDPDHAAIGGQGFAGRFLL